MTLSDTDQINLLLQRTPLNVSFSQFLSEVEKQFPSIGKIQSTEPITEGYEDANIILNTKKGKFVIKIFLTERTQEAIYSYIKIMLECQKVDVPTLELVREEERALGIFEYDNVKAQYMITHFFEGKNFENTTPTIKEIQLFTSYIARLNTLNFQVGETYDSWGNKNFALEFHKKKSSLTPEQLKILKPIYQQFLTIPLDTFSKSVIHGDLQRKHILRNDHNQYCLIDFGCMANGPKVIELSTYLAWFALQKDTWNQKDKIYELVLDSYTSVHTLTEEEIKSIPTLIRTAYASYLLSTAYLVKNGDASEETGKWHEKSKTMLELTKEWK